MVEANSDYTQNRSDALRDRETPFQTSRIDFTQPNAQYLMRLTSCFITLVTFDVVTAASTIDS
jgi:hypothetical protein